MQDLFNCTKLKGYISYLAVTKCFDDWCEKNVKNEYIDVKTDKNSLRISNLIPFSNYSLVLRVIRKKSNESADGKIEKNFFTKPDGMHKMLLIT